VIVLSAHAEKAILRRQLRRSWVELTILDPDRTEPDPGDPSLTRSFRVIPDVGGRVLRVVHRPDGDDILVITAFLDRRAQR